MKRNGVPGPAASATAARLCHATGGITGDVVPVVNMHDMKKQHLRLMVADFMEGFRKMRSVKTDEVKKHHDKKKAEAEDMIRDYMVCNGIPVVDGEGSIIDPLSNKAKRKKMSDNGASLSYTSSSIGETPKNMKKKKTSTVYCSNIFSETGRDILEVKILDSPYGVRLFSTITDPYSSICASDGGVSMGIDPGDDVSRTRGAGPLKVMTPTRVPSTVAKKQSSGRQMIEKRRGLRPAHDRYGTMVTRQLEVVGDILYKRKRDWAKGDHIEKSDLMDLENICKDVYMGADTVLMRSEHRRYEKQADRKAKLSQMAVADHKMKTESTSELGEKKLLAFIQRFHGGFFYQKKQLFFEGFQHLFLNSIIPILAPNIVGPSWSVIGPRLCKQYGWTRKDFQDVMVAQAPRRFGKTIAIAAIVINYLLAKSPCEIAVFSTCKRVSGFLLEKVKDIMIQSGYKDWIISIGGEHIYMRDPEDPDDQVRKISFYPASVVIRIFSFLYTYARIYTPPSQIYT